MKQAKGAAMKKIVKRERAQGMVEFALVLPLLLLVMFALIEFGRLLFVYSAVFTSSREAARYGSAAGNVGNYLPHYRHCDGMRAAAMRIGTLVGIADGDIAIHYDNGDPANSFGSCPAGNTGPSEVTLGNRVVVQVSAMYQPIVPLVRIPAFPISSTSARTILKDISIAGTPPAPTGSVSAFFDPETQAVDEGDPGEPGTPYEVTLQIRLSAPTAADVTVHFSIDGGGTSAISGTDFALLTSSPVTILAGFTSSTVTVRVLPDLMDEDDETVMLRIVDVDNGNLGTPDTHTLSITDDDDPPTVDFVPPAQDMQEDDGVGGISNFVTLQLSNPSGRTITVPFSIDDLAGTAVLDQDYEVNTSSPVTFAPGETSKLILFTSILDDLDEQDETVVFVMGDPVNAVKGLDVHTTTILDNDEPPEVFFTWEESEVPEEVGTVDVQVELSAPSGNDIEVSYSTGGTATLIDDYNLPPGPLVIPAGQSTTVIPVTVNTDLEDEEPETVIISISAAVNATVGSPGVHTMTITSIANPPTVSFSQQSQSASESVGSVTVVAQLSNMYFEDVIVPFSLSGTASSGADYTVASGQITIPAGSATGSVSVIVVNDPLDEDDETVILTMSQPANAFLGFPTVHTLTIQDDDALPSVYFTTASQSGYEDVGTMQVTVRLSPVSGRNVTVPFSVTGSATEGSDFSVSPANTVVIPAGSTEATINIQVIFDTELGESDETIILIIGTPTNASRGSTYDRHIATILAWICPSAASDPYFGTGNDNKKLIWELQNNDPNTVNLLEVTVFWPTGNGAVVDGIVFGSDPIGSGFYYPASLGYLDVINPSPLWSGVFTARQMTFLFDKRPNINGGQEIVVSARFENCLPFSKRIGN